MVIEAGSGGPQTQVCFTLTEGQTADAYTCFFQVIDKNSDLRSDYKHDVLTQGVVTWCFVH